MADLNCDILCYTHSSILFKQNWYIKPDGFTVLKEGPFISAKDYRGQEYRGADCPGAGMSCECPVLCRWVGQSFRASISMLSH